MEPYPDHLLNHLVRRETGVHVERTDPDINNLAWATVGKLMNKPHAVGSDYQATAVFRHLMRRMPGELNVYANPWSVVTAASTDRKFLVTARSEQRAWHKRLVTIFFSSAHVQKHFGLRGPKKATTDPAVRQLEYHGVLVVGGRHIFPGHWPDSLDQEIRVEQPKRLSLVGQSFGRLTVIADLTHQRHRCRCTCGNLTVADRNHLRSGRRKSCGCLAEAQRMVIAARRHSRGR